MKQYIFSKLSAILPAKNLWKAQKCTIDIMSWTENATSFHSTASQHNTSTVASEGQRILSKIVFDIVYILDVLIF